MDSVRKSLARKFLFSRFIVPVLIVDTCSVGDRRVRQRCAQRISSPVPCRKRRLYSSKVFGVNLSSYPGPRVSSDFFKPVHPHGELDDLPGIIFLFPVLGEIFLLPIVLAGVIEGFGALFQKIFFPISQKIGKKAVF